MRAGETILTTKNLQVVFCCRLVVALFHGAAVINLSLRFPRQKQSSSLQVRTSHLANELGFTQTGPSIIMHDNQGAMVWGSSGFRTAKHVAIRGTFRKENVERILVTIKYFPTAQMPADIFTKPLAREQFERHRESLRVLSAPLEYNRSNF